MKLKVVRAFLIRGERQEPGAVVDVTREFGRELIFTQRAVAIEEIAPAKGPMTTDTADGLVSGVPKRKGGFNAEQ